MNILMDTSIRTVKESLNKGLSREAIKVIEKTLKMPEDKDSVVRAANNAITRASINLIDYTDILGDLKSDGIKSIKTQGEYIYMKTAKGTSFYIKPPILLNDEAAAIFVDGELDNRSGFYGIKPFIKFVDNYKRFDLIKKGLGFSSNELKPLNEEQKEKAAAVLRFAIDKNASANSLFSNSLEAFYPDLKNDTVYCVRITPATVTANDITTCKLIKDENGNLIGYERSFFDIVRGKILQRKYVEPQEPTIDLPPLIETQNPKRFAQAHRFGNYPISERYDNSVNNIKIFLKQSGIEINSDNLKCIRFIDKNERKNTHFAYYSPNNGRSLVFDRDGKLLHTIDYLRNEDGEIVNISESTK